MDKLALTLTALSLLAAPALAGNNGSGTAAGYGSILQGVQQSTSRQPSAPAVRPTSLRARSFNFSGRLPTEEDFRRSLRS
jgi:predicted phage tail protein